MTDEEFWTRCEPDPNSGCWLWTGNVDGAGYGYIYRGKRHYGAHRHAVELALDRPMHPGTFAVHSCDTPLCINPNHLREGTPAQNTADMIRRRRNKTDAGISRNPKKLPPEMLAVVAQMLAAGHNDREIAAVAGRSKTAIWQYRHGFCQLT